MKTTLQTNTMVLYGSLLAAVALLFTPAAAQAQISEGDAGKFGNFISALTDLVNDFLIPFLIALCVLAFIYGVFKFFILGSSDEEARSTGRSLMLYALIGFVAIVALWAIVEFLVQAFGFTEGEAKGIRGPETSGSGGGGTHPAEQ